MSQARNRMIDRQRESESESERDRHRDGERLRWRDTKLRYNGNPCVIPVKEPHESYLLRACYQLSKDILLAPHFLIILPPLNSSTPETKRLIHEPWGDHTKG